MRRFVPVLLFLTVAFGLPWATHSRWGAVLLMMGLGALGVYGWRTARQPRD